MNPNGDLETIQVQLDFTSVLLKILQILCNMLAIANVNFLLKFCLTFKVLIFLDVALTNLPQRVWCMLKPGAIFMLGR